MLVQINSDNRIDVGSDRIEPLEARLTDRLGRFADRLTRVEVHLSDSDGDRNGPDSILAVIEARPSGDRPVSVSGTGGDVDGAFAAALRKLVDVLDRQFAKAQAVS